MATVNESLKEKSYSAEAIKRICLDAGADDVGLVDLDRESVQKEKEGILHVYPNKEIRVVAGIMRKQPK